MANRLTSPGLLFCLLLLAGCGGGDAGRPPAPQEKRSELAPTAGEADGAGVRLALLQPSGEMLMAAREGVLHVEGPCLYVIGTDSSRSRTLPLFHIADIRWDPSARVLKVGNAAFSPGERIVLTGGETANAEALPWVQRPDPACETSNLFIAGMIEPASAMPHAKTRRR